MVVCAVKLCRNYTGKNVKPSEDISFHRFPTDSDQKEQWIRALRRGSDWTPGTHCRVCSVHFDDDDFKISETGRRILLKDAIPTKNLYKEERRSMSGSRTKRLKKGRVKRRRASHSTSALMACRACLATEAKLYGILSHGLREALGELAGVMVSEDDGYPQHLCSVCFTLIEMFIEFKLRCRHVQDLLRDAKDTEGEITTDCIRSIDRDSNQLHNTQLSKTTKELKPRTSPEPNIKEEHETVHIPLNLNDIDSGSNHDINGIDDDGFDIFDEEKLADLKHRTQNCHINDSCTVKIEVENENREEEETIAFTEPLVIHGTVVPKHEILDTKKHKVKRKKVHGKYLANRKRKIKGEDKVYKENKIKSEKLVKLEENEDIRRSKPRKTDEDYENFAKEYSVDIVFLSREEQIAEILARREGDNYKNSKFKCEDCFKGFSTEGAFINHRSKHDLSAGSYECEACRFRFPKRYKLLHHQTQHKNNFLCKICGQVSKLASKAMEHYKWHNGVKYPCQFCDKVFCKRTSQFNHMRMRHGSASCDICQEIFSGERGLLTHMQKAHKEAARCRCDGCGVQFHSGEALTRHVDPATGCRGHGKACAQCGENLESEEALHEHMRANHWTEIKCEKCDATFENEKLYRMHRIVHKEVRQRSPRAAPPGAAAKGGRGPAAGAKGRPKQKIQKRMCEMCGLTWRSTAALKYHQRVHTGEKPHQCPVCAKSFRIQDSLQIHMNTHTGARPFKCPHCPKAFKSRTQNHKHQLVHTKVRRYRCDLCDKTFQTSTCVKTHIRTVHMKIPLPPRVRHRHRNDIAQEDMRLAQDMRPMESRGADLGIRLPDVYSHMGVKLDGLDNRQ